MFFKKLMDFSSSNLPCDSGTPPLLSSLCKVFASGLPPTSRTSNGNNFCKGLLRSFLSPVLEATSTVAPRTKPSFPGCTSTILPNFQVLRFEFPSSITVTISPGATDCATLACGAILDPPRTHVFNGSKIDLEI